MKPRYFVAVAVLAVLFGLFQLTVNSRRSAQLRQQVINKDQTGNDISNDITALEQYVHNHMNASTRFELTGSYMRAVSSSQPAAPSGALYAQAQSACAGKSDSVTQARCVTDYVSKRLPAPVPPVKPPDRSNYSREFNSPIWTPDLAGISLLAGAVSLLIAATKLTLRPKTLKS